MPLHVERIEWMPSPPLAPDDGPIDTGHLARMTLGDPELQREVLGMFVDQAARLTAILATGPSNASMLVHTLKGSARGIGAFRVAETAAAVEAAVRGGEDAARDIANLREAVAEACAAINSIMRRS